MKFFHRMEVKAQRENNPSVAIRLRGLKLRSVPSGFRIVQEIILCYNQEFFFIDKKNQNPSGKRFNELLFIKKGGGLDLFPLAEMVIEIEEMTGDIPNALDLFKDC